MAVELTVSVEGGDCQEATETGKEKFSSSRLVSMEIKLTLTRGLQLCWQMKAQLCVTPAVTSLQKVVCFSQRSLRSVMQHHYVASSPEGLFPHLSGCDKKKVETSSVG